jgi:hypothetical protein
MMLLAAVKGLQGEDAQRLSVLQEVTSVQVPHLNVLLLSSTAAPFMAHVWLTAAELRTTQDGDMCPVWHQTWPA